MRTTIPATAPALTVSPRPLNGTRRFRTLLASLLAFLLAANPLLVETAAWAQAEGAGDAAAQFKEAKAKVDALKPMEFGMWESGLLTAASGASGHKKPDGSPDWDYYKNEIKKANDAINQAKTQMAALQGQVEASKTSATTSTQAARAKSIQALSGNGQKQMVQSLRNAGNDLVKVSELLSNIGLMLFGVGLIVAAFTAGFGTVLSIAGTAISAASAYLKGVGTTLVATSDDLTDANQRFFDASCNGAKDAAISIAVDVVTWKAGKLLDPKITSALGKIAGKETLGPNFFHGVWGRIKSVISTDGKPNEVIERGVKKVIDFGTGKAIGAVPDNADAISDTVDRINEGGRQMMEERNRQRLIIPKNAPSMPLTDLPTEP